MFSGVASFYSLLVVMGNLSTYEPKLRACFFGRYLTRDDSISLLYLLFLLSRIIKRHLPLTFSHFTYSLRYLFKPPVYHRLSNHQYIPFHSFPIIPIKKINFIYSITHPFIFIKVSPHLYGLRCTCIRVLHILFSLSCRQGTLFHW
jgi:hypothetical protein